MIAEVQLTMPWPPSVNHYWRNIVLGGRKCRARVHTFISEEGNAFRRHVCNLVLAQKIPRGEIHGRLAVFAIAHPPDRRARDLDNLWKGVLDSLKHAGVIRDDGDIDDLHIQRGEVVRGGCLRITIKSLGDAQAEMVLQESA